MVHPKPAQPESSIVTHFFSNTHGLPKGAKIKVQTQYILCTRSKRKHRKAIEVCHKCQYLKSCDDYQQSQAPELVKALDELLQTINKKRLRLEDLLYFKKEIEELAALFRE